VGSNGVQADSVIWTLNSDVLTVITLIRIYFFAFWQKYAKRKRNGREKAYIRTCQLRKWSQELNKIWYPESVSRCILEYSFYVAHWLSVSITEIIFYLS
jgi:hypothetical protein